MYNINKSTQYYRTWSNSYCSEHKKHTIRTNNLLLASAYKPTHMPIKSILLRLPRTTHSSDALDVSYRRSSPLSCLTSLKFHDSQMSIKHLYTLLNSFPTCTCNTHVDIYNYPWHILKFNLTVNILSVGLINQHPNFQTINTGGQTTVMIPYFATPF